MSTIQEQLAHAANQLRENLLYIYALGNSPLERVDGGRSIEFPGKNIQGRVSLEDGAVQFLEGRQVIYDSREPSACTDPERAADVGVELGIESAKLYGSLTR